MQELDAVAVPLNDDFTTKHPKIHPISLHLEEYKDVKWDGYYITLIGHAYGLPLSHAIASVTENDGESATFSYAPALTCLCSECLHVSVYVYMKELTI